LNAYFNAFSSKPLGQGAVSHLWFGHDYKLAFSVYSVCNLLARHWWNLRILNMSRSIKVIVEIIVASK
jgi:hypothetical protein